jgi:hypothetical protein
MGGPPYPDLGGYGFRDPPECDVRAPAPARASTELSFCCSGGGICQCDGTLCQEISSRQPRDRVRRVGVLMGLAAEQAAVALEMGASEIMGTALRPVALPARASLPPAHRVASMTESKTDFPAFGPIIFTQG